MRFDFVASRATIEDAMNLSFKSRTARRLGAFAFLFFLVKGLLWLTVPLLLVWWAA